MGFEFGKGDRWILFSAGTTQEARHIITLVVINPSSSAGDLPSPMLCLADG
jgi:hypothetical protein